MFRYYFIFQVYQDRCFFLLNDLLSAAQMKKEVTEDNYTILNVLHNIDQI